MTSDSNFVILYLAYGNKNIFNQVLFSLLTLHFHTKNEKTKHQVVIYTDNPAYFLQYESAFNLKFETLSPEIIERFKGKFGFIHRIKICVIKDCLQKYKADVFYLDSDTFFNESPLKLVSKINRSTSIMNSDDYDLQHADELYENQDWLKIRRAIRDFSYVVDNKTIKIALSTRMWNAGVIGISYYNINLLDKILDLTDQIYNNKKVFTAEQFAFSYYLQTNTQLISTGETIMHYWPNHIGMYWKNQYDLHIKKFLKNNRHQSISETSKNAFELTKLHPQIIMQQPKGIFEKIYKRLTLIWKVAKSGKINNL